MSERSSRPARTKATKPRILHAGARREIVRDGQWRRTAFTPEEAPATPVVESLPSTKRARKQKSGFVMVQPPADPDDIANWAIEGGVRKAKPVPFEPPKPPSPPQRAPKRTSEVEEDVGAPAKKRARVDGSLSSTSRSEICTPGDVYPSPSEGNASTSEPEQGLLFEGSLWWETSAEPFAQNYESFLNDFTGEASSSTSGSIPLDYTPLLPESLIGEAPQLSWEELQEIFISIPTQDQFPNAEGAKAPLNAFDLFLCYGGEPPPEAEDQNRP